MPSALARRSSSDPISGSSCDSASAFRPQAPGCSTRSHADVSGAVAPSGSPRAIESAEQEASSMALP